MKAWLSFVVGVLGLLAGLRGLRLEHQRDEALALAKTASEQLERATAQLRQAAVQVEDWKNVAGQWETACLTSQTNFNELWRVMENYKSAQEVMRKGGNGKSGIEYQFAPFVTNALQWFNWPEVQK